MDRPHPRTVRDDDAGILADGLVGDSGCEIVGEQDDGLGRGTRGDVVKEKAGIVPRAVGDFLGVAGLHG